MEPTQDSIRQALSKDTPVKPDWHRLAEKPAEAMPVRLALAQHFMGHIYESWVTDDRERGDEPAKDQNFEMISEQALMMADTLIRVHCERPPGSL